MRAEPRSLAERVKAVGRALGLDRVGIAPAAPPPHAEGLRDWLARGHAGEMDWLARRAAEREYPRRVLRGARSIVAAALALPREPEAAPAEGPARVARYARGDDYHEVLGSRLRSLAFALGPLAGRPVRARWYVDTGPVLERAVAARAGLGWIGKNTLLLDRELGSQQLLGVVLTDLALAPDAPEPDHCGTCRACLDACPTDAFPEPYVLDARRCLSYTTIELRGAIPETLRAAQGERVFGCDACQDVCPWNRQGGGGPAPPDPLGLHARTEARPGSRSPPLAWLLGLDEQAWRASTRRSALRRARFQGLLRNALVAAGNSGGPELVPLLERHAAGGDAVLAEHARWALERLRARARGPGS